MWQRSRLLFFVGGLYILVFITGQLMTLATTTTSAASRVGDPLPLDMWQRHIIDSNKPWPAHFITTADIDGDNRKDVITGPWWYKNPGTPGGVWMRTAVGNGLENMAAVYDFDGDTNPDILGTGGEGIIANDTFVWAHNDGSGNFTLYDNIDAGDGDYLHGVAINQLQPSSAEEIALSWHAPGNSASLVVGSST